MIIYFSGTGNSAYIAKRISDITGGNTVSMNGYIKSGKNYIADKDERFIFVVPTYAWRIPRITENFIKNIRQSGKHSAYFILTCNGKICNSEKYIRKLCNESGINFMGCVPVVMPGNYIAMFDVQNKDEAVEIIENAQSDICRIAKLINDNKQFEKTRVSFIDRILSGFLNTIFYPIFVHAKKFYAKDSCIGCGRCEQLCPLNNISLINGKPVWQDNCTHCMACISNCPVSAIEYANETKVRSRYTCPF